MGETNEFYGKIWPHLSHHPDRLIDPTNAFDAPVVVINPRYNVDHPVSLSVVTLTREQEIDEQMRLETVRDMILHPRQRRFMERVMPIEWCHKRYPEVYQ